MKFTTFCPLALLLTLPFTARAEGIELIEDIRPGRDSSHDEYRLVPGFLNLGGIIVFEADLGGAIGHEVWRTDGSTGGTRPLKIEDRNRDRNPWEGDYKGAVVGNYYVAPYDFEDVGLEPATTDGSTVTPLGDLDPGEASSFPRHFVNAGGIVYFSVSTPESTRGWQIYQTTGSGTPTNTNFLVQAQEILGNVSLRPEALAPLGNTNSLLALTARYLFLYDGGTWSLINQDDPSFTTLGFYPAESLTYFLRNSELWVTDGTEGGTKVLLPTEQVSFRAIYNDTIGDYLFFRAAVNGEDTKEIWRLDGTSGQAQPFTNIQSDYINPPRVKAVWKNRVFVAVPNQTLRDDIFVYENQLGAEPVTLAEFVGMPGVNEITNTDFFIDGDLLYFTNLGDLIVTDGTPEGSRIICPDFWAYELDILGGNFISHGVPFPNSSFDVGTELFRITEGSQPTLTPTATPTITPIPSPTPTPTTTPLPLPGFFSILSPGGGETLEGFRVNFEWEASEDAEYYVIRVELSSGSVQAATVDGSKTSLEVNFPDTIKEGVPHTWIAIAWNESGQRISRNELSFFKESELFPGLQAILGEKDPEPIQSFDTNEDGMFDSGDILREVLLLD